MHSADRDYNYAAIAAIVDYTVVMDYVDHQVWHPRPDGLCVAGSDAKLPDVVEGVQQFIALCGATDAGVPRCNASNFMMGIAQSGFVMPCLPGTKPTAALCPIAPHPWRGANCTYLSGHEVPFVDLMAVIRGRGDQYGPGLIRTTNVRVDATVASATFNYVDNSTGAVWQAWMETPETGAQKFGVARDMRLGGIMMRNLDWLNYTASPPDADDTRQWYRATDAFTKGAAP